MNFIAQVDDEQNGYLMMSETPWDTNYHVHHENHTKVYFTHLPSLGKMNYRRIIHVIFTNKCDVDKLCEIYRMCTMEKGIFVKKQEESTNLSIFNLKADAKDIVQNADGSLTKILCVAKMLPYIKKEVMENTYKDVLLSGFEEELLECNHPAHRISKKQCMEKRLASIHYLTSKSISLWVSHKVEYLLPYVNFTKDTYEVECGEKINLFDKIYYK